MSQVIIYTNDSGGVSICTPTGEVPMADVLRKDIPAGVQSFVVRASSLPEQDNDFFDAWEQTNGVVTVNIAKAREVTKRRLRIERAPLLAAQDVAFQRALETGADTTAIVAEKQRLRDIPELADAAESLADLRAIKAERQG